MQGEPDLTKLRAMAMTLALQTRVVLVPPLSRAAELDDNLAARSGRLRSRYIELPYGCRPTSILGELAARSHLHALVFGTDTDSHRTTGECSPLPPNLEEPEGRLALSGGEAAHIRGLRRH